MLRITVDAAPALISLKLEGKLRGVWVKELERVWQSIRSRGEPTAVRADLGAVSFVDEHGKALLALMRRAGVILCATDPMMKAIIEEVSQDLAAFRSTPEPVTHK